jgi:hypothetical protein
MNSVKANYFDAYRSLKLTRGTNGALVALGVGQGITCAPLCGGFSDRPASTGTNGRADVHGRIDVSAPGHFQRWKNSRLSVAARPVCHLLGRRIALTLMCGSKNSNRPTNRIIERQIPTALTDP